MALKPGVTTVHDLGRMAGCSVTTVSRVLNNSGAVSPHQREAVLKAIRETDFYTSRARKGGRRSRPGSDGNKVVEIIQHRHSPIEHVSMSRGELKIGPLVAPWGGEAAEESTRTDNSFHRGIMDGAMEELARWGFRAQFQSNSNLLDQGFLAELNGPERGGVLLIGESSADLTQFVRNCRHPLVLVDVLGDEQVDVVTSDNLVGIGEAFRHLYELGHRRIGFIGAREHITGRMDERYSAYKLNMVDRDLTLRSDWVYHGYGHIAEVTEAVGAMLKRADRPTALICQNDCCAFGVIRAASRLGVSIPGQLSVVGFDDVDSASLVTPALTTMRVPVREMGRQAVRELMIHIKVRPPVRARGCRVRMLPELIIRESTAAAAGE